MTKILKTHSGETPRYFNAIVNVFGAATVVLVGFLTMLQFAAA
jgi:hypothetical protein